MVFIPILILDLEVGQLFRDIAVAISVSVVLSLLIAVTLIPALSKRLLAGPVSDPGSRRDIPIVDPFARGFTRFVVGATRRVVSNRLWAVCVISAGGESQPGLRYRSSATRLQSGYHHPNRAIPGGCGPPALGD
jgi:HAE1 family hydrophobic/amphiphilic exporter-1